MMRFQTALSAGLATFLVVPAIVVGDDDIATFRDALANTDRALELLGGIQKKLAAGEKGGSGLIRSVTEAPILDAQRRDERLMSLRNDIGLLQTELELIEGEAPPPSSTLPPIPPPAPSPLAADGSPQPKVHTGLDEATRRALQGPGEAGATAPPRPRGPAASGPVTTVAPPISPEGPGYSANPVRQARACFYAGRFDQGAALLANVKDDAQALYWRARCREKLDRLDEAIADLRRVLELTTDESETRRAQTDLQFIEWKKGFVEKLDPGKRSKKKGR